MALMRDSGGDAVLAWGGSLHAARKSFGGPWRFWKMDVRAGGAKFPLGQLVMTQGASSALSVADITAAVRRHVQGDWGEVDQEDWRENDLSLEEGFRLLSAYTSEGGEQFWIITEADRSVTTVLLPSEY